MMKAVWLQSLVRYLYKAILQFSNIIKHVPLVLAVFDREKAGIEQQQHNAQPKQLKRGLASTFHDGGDFGIERSMATTTCSQSCNGRAVTWQGH
jgi:hypothetical protein